MGSVTICNEDGKECHTPNACNDLGCLKSAGAKPVAVPALAHLTADSAARKEVPICTGVLDYFPDALADVARLSKIGNDKHNPGQPLHWSRGKSDDHADCLLRHQVDRGKIDTDGVLHDAKVAWRALAQLQLAIEKLRAQGVPY